MEFKNTAEVLHAQAREITNMIAQLETSDKIPAIEIDLLLEKLRNIYDLVKDMQTSLSLTENSQKSEIQTQRVEKELSPEPEDIEKSSGENTKESIASARKPIEKERAGEKSDESEKPEKNSFVSDRFKSSKPTLNEEIAGKSKKKDISSQLQSSPISSISGAIGLNEKFELINELFEGDKDTFESTLQVLNMAGSFVEAYNYLDKNFNWDMDNAYVQRILELIRRKLIVRRNEQ